ncbi:hypothetical protein A3Q56_05829 [Intoshia linei]|uniref:Uncharacterized protein n=1 Tax=Intoshia linei TaxID=1819745 RepID=A0A177AWP7_9BILA|nr:hypothetical protein A3Q56_05829 [Intoshia linei]
MNMNQHFWYVLLLVSPFSAQKLVKDIIHDILELKKTLTPQEVQTYKIHYADRKLYDGILESRLTILLAGNILAPDQVDLLITELILGYVSPLHILFFKSYPYSQIMKSLKNVNDNRKNVLREFEFSDPDKIKDYCYNFHQRGS